MASDDVVWDIINHQFCSFKLKLPGNESSVQKSTKSTFCRNEHNVSGLCNRISCPLANSRYATVRADPQTQRIYLYVKEVERTHLPSRWWEKIRLSRNAAKAQEQIELRLMHWTNFYRVKCMQRLQRLNQVRVRSQRLAKEEERLGETLVPRLAPKIRRREETRERKAEKAANIEKAIERELIERLRSGAYGEEPVNVDEKVWNKVLRGLERAGQGERDVDLDEDEAENEEEGVEYEYEQADGERNVEYVSDVEESEEDDIEDVIDQLSNASDSDNLQADASEESGDDDDTDKSGRKRKRKTQSANAKRRPTKKAPINIEIEREYEPMPRQRQMELAR